MRYALLVYETEAGVKTRSDSEYQAAYKAYIRAIYDGGVAFAGSGLQDAATTATTFRLVDGKRQIQDGPFVDTKEQLAGFFLIDVPDLDGPKALAELETRATMGKLALLPQRTVPKGLPPSRVL